MQKTKGSLLGAAIAQYAQKHNQKVQAKRKHLSKKKQFELEVLYPLRQFIINASQFMEEEYDPATAINPCIEIKTYNQSPKSRHQSFYNKLDEQVIHCNKGGYLDLDILPGNDKILAKKIMECGFNLIVKKKKNQQINSYTIFANPREY